MLSKGNLMKKFMFAMAVMGSFALTANAYAGGYKEIEVKDGGTISGTVLFKGAVPPKKATGKDVDVCHADTPDPSIIATDGKLANVVVYLKKVKKGKAFTDAQKAVVSDQKACIFVPHVALVAEKGKVEFKNSDAKLHNVKVNSIRNGNFNEGVDPHKSLTKAFNKGHDAIKVSCSVHEWMSSWVIVMPHPYYAVTAADGSFKLENVPAGKYKVIVWHGAKENACDVAVDDGKAAKQKSSGVKVVVKKGKEVKITATYK
jgi:plastocyanin